MVDLSSFLKNILIGVPNCPQILAQRELLNTIIEFCDQSWIWQQDIDPIDVKIGVVEYDVERPSTVCAIAGLVSVKKDGQPFKAYTFIPNTMVLVDTPASAFTISVRLALKPTSDAVVFEDFLLRDWLDYLVAGTKARLMAIPLKPWSNEATAASLRVEFVKGVSLAKGHSNKNFTRTSLSARPRAFL